MTGVGVTPLIPADPLGHVNPRPQLMPLSNRVRARSLPLEDSRDKGKVNIGSVESTTRIATPTVKEEQKMRTVYVATHPAGKGSPLYRKKRIIASRMKGNKIIDHKGKGKEP